MENDQYKLESKKLNETVISLENYISDLKNQMEPPSWLRYDSFTNKDEIDFFAI
jgi:tetrahydromethanopterin S-methyltransferase subunit B